MERDPTIALLARLTAAGTLPTHVALPALGELAGGGEDSSASALLDALDGQESPVLRQLADHLEGRLQPGRAEPQHAVGGPEHRAHARAGRDDGADQRDKARS